MEQNTPVRFRTPPLPMIPLAHISHFPGAHIVTLPTTDVCLVQLLPTIGSRVPIPVASSGLAIEAKPFPRNCPLKDNSYRCHIPSISTYRLMSHLVSGKLGIWEREKGEWAERRAREWFFRQYLSPHVLWCPVAWASSTHGLWGQHCVCHRLPFTQVSVNICLPCRKTLPNTYRLLQACA